MNPKQTSIVPSCLSDPRPAEAILGDSRQVDVAALLGSAPVRRGHMVTVAVLFGVLLIDGYDLQITGQILPALATAFHVSTGSLAKAYAVQPLGQALGGLLLSPLADRFGRKPSLLVLLVLFAVATFLSTLADSLTSFAVMRFVSGALGGALLPTVASLVADIAPLKRRAAMVGFVYAALGVAPLVASGVVALVLDRFGWQSVYVIGAVAPILIVFLIVFLAPESPLHLARIGAPERQITASLRKLGISVGKNFSVARPNSLKRSRISLIEIFGEGRAAFTITLWVTCGCGLISVTMLGLASAFFHEFEKIPVAKYAAFAAFSGSLAIVSGMSMGFLMDRFGRYRVIAIYAVLSTICIIGQANVPFGSAPFVAFMVCAGFFTWGSYQGLNILTPLVYPAHLRSAAVGWKGGVSRISSTAAPLVAGILLSQNVGIEVAMVATATPMAFVAALCLALAILHQRME